MRPRGKKITREVLRENPFLASLFRARAKEVRAMLADKKAGELDLD